MYARGAREMEMRQEMGRDRGGREREGARREQERASEFTCTGSGLGKARGFSSAVPLIPNKPWFEVERERFQSHGSDTKALQS